MSDNDTGASTLYNLDLHESMTVGFHTDAMRVPGGWIYSTCLENGTGGYDIGKCFVPFHNEFHTVRAEK